MTEHTTPPTDDEMYASLAAAPVAGLTAEQGARTAAEADKARAREVDAHSEHRRALCEALGRHTGLDWPTAIHRVQLAVAGAADRDRAAIAQGAAERETRQARQGESDAVRALDLAEAAHNVRTQEANGWHTRAERAEATLAAVRALLPRMEKIATTSGPGPANAVRAAADWLLTALGDPQPAAPLPEAAVCNAYQPPATATDSGLCARCGMCDYKHTSAPAEVCCVCGCPDVTYRNHREQPFCCRCAECCEPPVLCAHGCQPAAEAVQTAVPEATPSAMYNLVTYIIERQWDRAARTTDQIHTDIEPLLAAIRAEDEPDLAALTVPVSPRAPQDADPDHPMYALADAMTGQPIERYEAYGLIKAYYDAITSDPPAEQPMAELVTAPERPAVIHVHVTGVQVRAAMRRIIREDAITLMDVTE